jgi:hypothetical protein
MSCEDSKRALHRQRQAAYEAPFAIATEAEQAGYRRRHYDAIERSSGGMLPASRERA